MDLGSAPETPIQLDLEPGASAPEPRRQRPQVESVAYERPKLEPVLKEGDVGSDETRQTVGFLMLAAMVPELIGGLFGHGSLSFVGVGIPVLTAWGLITGDDFICRYAFLSCLAQVATAPLLGFALPHPALMVPSMLLRYGGLAVLLSDRPLSRQAYILTLSAMGLGTVFGIIWSLL